MLTRRRKRNPSGRAGNCTWNADSTLASYPGPGYTRKLSYDEEGRLTKISRDNGTTITPVFEYGYGFDGNRRWRKDLAGNTWDWYPCGVACCAGELVTLRSTNGGASWTSLQAELPVLEGRVRNSVVRLTNVQGQSAVEAGSQVTIRLADADNNTRAGAPSVAVEDCPIEEEEAAVYTASLLIPIAACGARPKVYNRPCNKGENSACAKQCKKAGGVAFCNVTTVIAGSSSVTTKICVCKKDLRDAIKTIGGKLGCNLLCNAICDAATGGETGGTSVVACFAACNAACNKAVEMVE